MPKNRVEKYISFEERPTPEGKKTRIWWVIGRDKKPFGEVRWYGGWRKYVFLTTADSFFDKDCLRMIADFCEEKTKAHMSGKRPQRPFLCN